MKSQESSSQRQRLSFKTQSVSITWENFNDSDERSDFEPQCDLEKKERTDFETLNVRQILKL